MHLSHTKSCVIFFLNSLSIKLKGEKCKKKGFQNHLLKLLIFEHFFSRPVPPEFMDGMGSYSAMYPVVSCPASSVVITQPTTTTIRSNTLEAVVHNPPKETAICLEPKVLLNCQQHIKHTCKKVSKMSRQCGIFLLVKTDMIV